MDTTNVEQSQTERFQKFDLTQEEKMVTNRLNLHCIPEVLDKAIRMRLLYGNNKFICQQIVEDLVSLYQKEIEQIRKGKS